MATFRERVSSKGERKWQAIVRRDGYPAKRATFPTRRDAERWARIVEGEYAKGKHLPSLEAERHTFAELLDRYVKHDMTDKRRKACAAHLKFWREALGSKRLSELTPAAIREHRDRLRTEPVTRSFQRKAVTLTKRRKPKEGAPPPKSGKRSPAAVNRYMETLSKCLSVAVAEYEWLPENPAAKVSDMKESTQAAGARTRAGFQELLTDSPLTVGSIVFGLGLASGLALPTSDLEDREMGEMSDRVKSKARKVGSDVAHRAADVGHDVADTAVSRTREEVEDIRNPDAGEEPSRSP